MNNLIFSRSLLVVFVVTFIISIFPTFSFCEIQTITHTVKQPFGGSQSPDDARIAAVAKAKREVLEMAGVYIESLTVVKNSQVDKDEILALAAGVLKAEVVSQENYHTKDAFGIDVVVKVVVDTSVLENRVKKLLQDRTHLDQLNQARVREKELLDKIAALEKENRKSGKSKQKSANLKKEFQAASQGLTAVEWFRKAGELFINRKWTNPGKAIACLTEAIRLKPDYVDAYTMRGYIYKSGLSQYQRAIEDYNMAINLKPDYVDAYHFRAEAYCLSGQYQQAIQDYSMAVHLKPDDVDAYYFRADAYFRSGQHQRAIEDYNMAINLKPDYVDAYYLRGLAYLILGNVQEGCRSMLRACELGDCKGYELVKGRGQCF